jgi:uncharacterized repeat protein (TIGR01451 family)
MKNRYLNSAILFLAVTTAVFSVAFTASAESSWQLNDYNYRREIGINNPGNFVNDFQVLIVVNTASLISEGKMKSDCSDIRFVGSGGNILNHWLELGCNTEQTRFWVKMPNIPSGTSNNLYTYYGNSSASNVGTNIDSVMDNGLRVWYDYPSFDMNVLSIDQQELMNFLRRTGTCIENSVSHNWSGTPFISGCSGANGSLVKMVWTGWVINKGVGTHSFAVNSDNAARLYVGRELILEKSSSDTTNVSGAYSFSYPVALQMDFMKSNDPANISLGWTPADGSGGVTPIPGTYLRTNKTAFPNSDPEAGLGAEESRVSWVESTTVSQTTYEQPASNNYSYSNTNSNPVSSSNTNANYYSSNTTGEFTKKIKNITSGASEGYMTEAAVGETIHYTLTLNSSKVFYGIKIIDVLPSGVDFVSADTGAVYDSSSNAVKWDLGDISSPSNRTYSYYVKVSNKLHNGETVVNTALMESRDQSIQSNEAKFSVRAPELIITREMVATNQGADLSYRINYRNAGSLPVRAFIKEEYSGGIKFKGSNPAPKSSAENYANFEVLNLAPGASGSITVDLTKDPSLPKGSIGTINSRTDYYDDRGNSYPQIAQRTDIDLDSGRIISQPEAAPQQPPSQPAAGNDSGKVKGATDVQAGSYDNAILAAIIGMLGVLAVFAVRSNNFSRMRLSYELWRERNSS